jgi:AhpD family alkylhydroperoxidase
MRLNYAVIAPEATKALTGVNAALLRSGIDRRLMDLLFLRVSQINGCSYCVDLHARDLRRAGESNERLDGLAGWRESPYFTEPEKAALEWAEALTRVEVTHAPDTAYEPLARYHDDKQVANITYAIALMNAWNRVAIGFHHGPELHNKEWRAYPSTIALRMQSCRRRCMTLPSDRIVVPSLPSGLSSPKEKSNENVPGEFVHSRQAGLWLGFMFSMKCESLWAPRRRSRSTRADSVSY